MYIDVIHICIYIDDTYVYIMFQLSLSYNISKYNILIYISDKFLYLFLELYKDKRIFLYLCKSLFKS